MEGSQTLKIDIVDKIKWPCQSLKQKQISLRGELGRGTFGSVYKAFSEQTQQFYALKKMEHYQDKTQIGFPITTIRQIKLLQKLNHPNILNINNVFYEKTYINRHTVTKTTIPNIYICLDLMECDLLFLLRQPKYQLTCAKIQNILKQILQGLLYLHQNNIAHRDIKPANILINKKGQVKLADFGLAKKLKVISTVRVVTLWYRAPQLLLQKKNYTHKIDIWSVGCMLAQMMLGQPLFKQQQTELTVLNRIYELMGTPDRQDWQDQVQDLPIYKQTKPEISRQSQIVYHLRKSASKFKDETILLDLVEKMLSLNPNKRLSAEQCLNHKFFTKKYEVQELLDEKILQIKSKQGTDTIHKRIKVN